MDGKGGASHPPMAFKEYMARSKSIFLLLQLEGTVYPCAMDVVENRIASRGLPLVQFLQRH